LINNDRILTNETFKVINEIRDKGILFGIASGRPLDEITNYYLDWGFDRQFDVLIGLNGSVLFDNINHTTNEYCLMKKEWIKEVFELMKQFDSNPFIYRDHHILAKVDDEIMHLSGTKSRKEVVVATSDDQFYENDNAKIMFRVSKETMVQVEKYFNYHPLDNYKGFKTQETLFEFSHKDISKAVALEKFCLINHLDLKDVWAFGDTTNDNEMLKISGRGICLCNGSSDTLAVADVISDKSNDEDGFADYINKYLLKKEN
ncbi:MAG: HAD-IIB family hydrolase, partial [Erysipelotrichaceae bacterium]